MNIPHDYMQALLKEIKEKKHDKNALSRLKVRLCKEFTLKKIPTDIELFLNTPLDDVPLMRKYLMTKPTRSISGVTPVAVMTKPIACPHGKCTFCPGGPGSEFGDVPMSYTGKEPSTMRAMRASYDPYLIVMNRLEQFCVTGHVPEKVDIIIQGGTFCAFPQDYQEEVVKYIFKAMNDFSNLFYVVNVIDGKTSWSFDFLKFKEFFFLPGEVGDPKRKEAIHKKLLELKGECVLLDEQLKNETSAIKCIGLTIETKPDWGFKEHGNQILKLGCTRVELGIQTVYEEPLKVTHRGHDLKDSVKSIKELRDLGFKLNFHYMLGLPKVDRDMDRVGLSELFTNPDFKPDMLKIYPCMVMQGTPLHKVWKAGLFEPIDTTAAAEMIADFKKEIPTYCRIMRVQRDIPTYRTEAGVDKTNLRQYVDAICSEKKIVCKCIRCREVGHQRVKFGKSVGDVSLVVVEYDASSGKEFFISFEDVGQGILLGFVRLRFPSEALRDEITLSSGLIRELHVYDEAAGMGSEGKVQHRGLGKKLMAAAEKICSENGKDKVVVISGVGVRGYFRKLGYELEGPYMVKNV
jgi:elongator complex protein 3